MRVRISQSIATATGQLTAGQEYDLDDAEAKRLINAGQAVDPDGKVIAKLPESRGNPAGKENLDRAPGTPIEKLPSSLNIPGHEFKDPAASPLATGDLAAGVQASGGVAATNAPDGPAAAPEGSTPDAVRASQEDAGKSAAAKGAAEKAPAAGKSKK